LISNPMDINNWGDVASSGFSLQILNAS
jgi:hypothetical protein